MIRTLGVDHGTKGIRFCLLADNEMGFHEVERNPSEEPFLPFLDKMGFLDVDLIGLTYSMADDINAITPLGSLKNRGQIQDVTGEVVGAGTRLFDEIKDSGLEAVLIPGLHREIKCLDERFRFLYSHMAASEKTGLAYYAYELAKEKTGAESLIICDVSSNTVTMGLKEGRMFGAVDACLGALGLIHGPLDLEFIRQIDRGEIRANKAFYNAGAAPRAGITSEDVIKEQGTRASLAKRSILLAATMEIEGMRKIIGAEAIVLAGSLGLDKGFSSEIEKEFKPTPVLRAHPYGAAIGAAMIARDILKGKRDFLGIPCKEL